MPKISEEFSSNWLKSADLNGKEMIVTINSSEIESFKEEDGTKRKKVILAFDEIDQKLIVNTTNRDVLVELFGDDTDDWTGRKIILYVTKVTYAGKRVDGLRIRDRLPKEPKAKTTAKVTAPAPATDDDDSDDDDGEAPY
jgi:hypothetical protein